MAESNVKIERQDIEDIRDAQDDSNADLELQGLLSGQQRSNASSSLAKGKSSFVLFEHWADEGVPWSRKRMAAVALLLVIFILGASLSRPFLGLGFRKSKDHPNQKFVGSELRSNGTHDFKRTVLMVSIDGLRADYLDRNLTPHLLEISKKGLRAKYMKPIFPTLTFPNHWSLMTGLYAESHGIVGNNFWDPKSQSEFQYNKESSAWIPSWWLGEPIWETANRAGMITANLMWPGPPSTATGSEPTYFVPWKDKVPLDKKLEQILRWIDLPVDERPQLITAYEPSLDQAGHSKGPNSKLVNDTLVYVDTFAADLHKALLTRNLTEIVDVIFVSDHGMTDTSHPEPVLLDEILGEQGYADIEHEDGWPSAGLRFKKMCNETEYLHKLLEASTATGESQFNVFTHKTMPPRYHFSRNYRIAPIYVVPKIGYALTSKKELEEIGEGGSLMSKGNHGYDNDEPSMYATFVAHGPFSTNVKDVHQKRSSSLVRRAFGWGYNSGWHSVDNDVYVMNGFANVQIYGLVTKLLGIEELAAPNNGTKGFWDKYV